MKSPSTSSPAKGFTLIEVVIVTALFAILASLGLAVSMEAYRGYSFRSEESIVVSLLEHARSRALANFSQAPWGVCYDDASYQYQLFRGGSYIPSTSTNEPMPGSASVAVSGFPLCSSGSGVVFSQLAATTTAATITLTQGARTSTVSINYEGAINW